MIDLTPMTPAAFTAWRAQAVQAYAQDKITAHTWRKQDAAARAEAEYTRLLPRGLQTPNEWLWTITQAGAAVGALWVHHDAAQRSAYIYDIVIVPAHRDQGLGQQTLAALTTFCQDHGVQTISLHVFGTNLRAQHVYAKMGFAVTDLNMTKTL